MQWTICSSGRVRYAETPGSPGRAVADPFDTQLGWDGCYLADAVVIAKTAALDDDQHCHRDYEIAARARGSGSPTPPHNLDAWRMRLRSRGAGRLCCIADWGECRLAGVQEQSGE